jgi:hypothetical protein
MDRAAVIDLVRQVRIEISQRIVRERGEMHDGVASAQVGGLDVANILHDGGHLRHAAAERAAVIQVDVHAEHVVPGGLQAPRQDRADVAEMTGDEDAHGVRCGVDRGG